MTVTDEDRAKAQTVMGWDGLSDAYLTGIEIRQRDAIAAALASERAAADQLRADVLAVVRRLEAREYTTDWMRVGAQIAIDELRALLDAR